jgi:PQQ-dependent dehydrogenase (s-GDH family)
MFTANFRSLVFYLFSIIYSSTLSAQSNDCATPTLITPATSCTYVSGTLYLATSANSPASTCGTPYDVWYYFDVPANTTSVTISGVATGNNVNSSNTFIQAFSNSACSTAASSLGSCTPISTSLLLTNLTPLARYYFRVFSITTTEVNGANATKWGFNICVTYVGPPANDECTGATALTLGTANSSGTVWNATPSSGIPVGCATGTPDDDVWYSFVAATANATVTFNATGTDLGTAGPRLQLFSGSCTALTSLGCGTTSLTATALVFGTTYYIRVYSAAAGAIGTSATGSTFSITVANTTTTLPQYNIASSRTSELFQQVTLSPANALNDPWEITYGADGFLWITEAKGYKVVRMDPSTGVKTTVLDLSQGSTFLPAAEQSFNVQFGTTQSPWPQGGFAGLAMHPDFMHATDPKKYIFVSYVHTYNSTAANNAGVFFTNRVVRFTYNTATAKLESPVSLCDTLPGSSDHNSQRMIIAPVGGTNYLFYASGDMGSGQFGNAAREIKSQLTASYEGKILRFNLEPDTDAGTLDKWIPNDNPFNAAAQSAVWSTGMRNNQGFAYAVINGTGLLYGSSHGPYSDDEINIIESGKNYGHPSVIGYKSDGNYNSSKAGSPTGSLPLITSEIDNATAIGTTYRDPIFSAYAATQSSVNNMYLNSPPNGSWPSEGWSGMDIYTSTEIPGWKNSLVLGSLKWGRVLRLKLNSAGTAVVPTGSTDTVSYFGSTNRYRDVAFASNGKDLFVVMDKSSTTSGPSAANPVAPACPGCVQKYTFIGYQNNGSTNKSTIPTSIDVTTGTLNSCTPATGVTIDATNNNIWVPVTGPDGNIMAEIKANGNNLGLVSSSFYTHSGTVRTDVSGKPYLDRNIAITPQVQPAAGVPVSIRLYLTASELNTLIGRANSGITSISNLTIYKNSDACGTTVRSATQAITPLYAEAHGSSGYVLQANITSFSSFYFGSPNLITLPLYLTRFNGALNEKDVKLNWETSNEINTSHFNIERSTNGSRFETIGTVAADGNRVETAPYGYTDKDVSLLPIDRLYYRLKSVDKDGKFTFSSVITVRLPQAFDVLVFPNPVKSRLHIRINNRTAKEVMVEISDLQGRLVHTNRAWLQGGAGNVELDVRRWQPQLYIIKIRNRNAELLATQKFEKL